MGYNNRMKKALKLFAAATALLSLVGLSACNSQSDSGAYFYPVASYKEYKASGSQMAIGSGYAMATTASLKLTDENNFESETAYSSFVELWDKAKGVMLDVENSISTTVTSSCIYKFNEAAAGARVELNQTAYEIVMLAQSVYAQTEGYYNPAVYQSVQLYGFGQTGVTKPSKLPNEQTLQALKSLYCEFGNLKLEEVDGKYYATKPQKTVTVDGTEHCLKLDLGGIGKGYCADKINELIDKSGFKYGYFDFGSSTMAIKKHSAENQSYKLTFKDPRSYGGYYARVEVNDACLSTSGDYERYYEVDGVRYCHIIDPFSGSPVQTGIASVTVVGGSAAEDDALTTALAAMGVKKAVEYIDKNLSDRLVVMVVFNDGEGKIITNRTEDITVLNGAYSVGNSVIDGKIVLN